MGGKSRVGLAVASVLAAAYAIGGNAVEVARTVVHTAGSRKATRKRNELRDASRRVFGRWGDMINYDGIWHKQSNRIDGLPSGYPGAKMARKAAQCRLGLRH